MAALVTIGKATHKQRIERRAGYYAELTEFGNSIGKAPIGYPNAHAALDNFW
jgi:hypothetical protein